VGEQRWATVEWRDEFEIGVPEIDDQHRRLIALLAGFYEALGPVTAREALGELLSGLIDYTRYHFATEERLMLGTDYPMLQAHKAEHAGFVAKVSAMSKRFAENRLVLSFEATDFIREWLFAHILISDKHLGGHLRSGSPR
jgi:hemerythrin